MIGTVIKYGASIVAVGLVLFVILMSLGYLDYWITEVFG